MYFTTRGSLAGQSSKFWHKMWIGQKAHIEDQIGLLGHAMTESEADTGNQNTFSRSLLAKALRNVSAQFVHIELRRVDDNIGQGADACQVTPFGLDRSIDRRVDPQGMRPARLAETSQQRGIGSFEKSNFRRNGTPDGFENSRELIELRSFAHIDHQSRAADLSGL